MKQLTWCYISVLFAVVNAVGMMYAMYLGDLLPGAAHFLLMVVLTFTAASHYNNHRMGL